MAQAGKRTQAGRPLLIAAAILLCFFAAWAAVHNAIHRSQDFQWSGERLLLHHIDPWRDYLLGDPAHALIATQVPNYLPILYVLLVPFGLLSAPAANLAWAVCNVLFAVVSAVLAARFYGLRSRPWIFVVTAILLAAVPTRTAIGNGQQCLFVLFLWSVALLTARPTLSPSRAMLTGISYLKYSFAPAIALYLLLRGRLRKGNLGNGMRLLLWSLLPSAFATVAIWLWLTGGHAPRTLLALIFEPLAVAQSGYQPTSDPGITLMDLGELAIAASPVATPPVTALVFAIAIALTAGVLLLARRKLGRHGTLGTDMDQAQTGWLLALTATMSFTFYKHHAYDEVVFLFPLCYALRHRAQAPAKIALALIGYHWFLQRLLDARLHFSWLWNTTRLLSFCALIACIYLTFMICRKAGPARDAPDRSIVCLPCRHQTESNVLASTTNVRSARSHPRRQRAFLQTDRRARSATHFRGGAGCPLSPVFL